MIKDLGEIKRLCNNFLKLLLSKYDYNGYEKTIKSYTSAAVVNVTRSLT